MKILSKLFGQTHESGYAIEAHAYTTNLVHDVYGDRK